MLLLVDVQDVVYLVPTVVDGAVGKAEVVYAADAAVFAG